MANRDIDDPNAVVDHGSSVAPSGRPAADDLTAAHDHDTVPTAHWSDHLLAGPPSPWKK
jgi:hypothetical protein